MQGICSPIIGPAETGGAVTGFTVNVLMGLSPQPFDATTETVPLALPTVTTIAGVPCPETIVQPVGTVQLYVAAPAVAATEYVRLAWPAQGLPAKGAVIGPGFKGLAMAGVTFSNLGALSPQSFDAITVITPGFVPAVTVMLLVPGPAVIVQPVGTVQL